MCAQDRLAETIVIDVRKQKAEAPMADASAALPLMPATPTGPKADG
jgi:hypothetical protein